MKRQKFAILLGAVVLSLTCVGCDMTNTNPGNRTRTKDMVPDVIEDIIPGDMTPNNTNNNNGTNRMNDTNDMNNTNDTNRMNDTNNTNGTNRTNDMNNTNGTNGTTNTTGTTNTKVR